MQDEPEGGSEANRHRSLFEAGSRLMLALNPRL
jgi:hypothetical protein